MFKLQGYILAAFLLMLVFPFFTTIVGLKLIPEAPWGGPKIAALIKSEGSVQVLPENTINGNPVLKIGSASGLDVPVRVTVSCSSMNGRICDDKVEVSVPEKEFSLSPGVFIELPITLYTQDLLINSALINYTVVALDGRIYGLGVIELKSS